MAKFCKSPDYEEEVYVNFFESLGVAVKNREKFIEECQSMLLLEVFEKMQPNFLSWSNIESSPKNRYHKISNLSFLMKSLEKSGIRISGVWAKDLLSPSPEKIHVVIWSMMTWYYKEKVLEKQHTVEEVEILNWADKFRTRVIVLGPCEIDELTSCGDRELVYKEGIDFDISIFRVSKNFLSRPNPLQFEHQIFSWNVASQEDTNLITIGRCFQPLDRPSNCLPINSDCIDVKQTPLGLKFDLHDLKSKTTNVVFNCTIKNFHEIADFCDFNFPQKLFKPVENLLFSSMTLSIAIEAIEVLTTKEDLLEKQDIISETPFLLRMKKKLSQKADHQLRKRSFNLNSNVKSFRDSLEDETKIFRNFRENNHFSRLLQRSSSTSAFNVKKFISPPHVRTRGDRQGVYGRSKVMIQQFKPHINIILQFKLARKFKHNPPAREILASYAERKSEFLGFNAYLKDFFKF